MSFVERDSRACLSNALAYVVGCDASEFPPDYEEGTEWWEEVRDLLHERGGWTCTFPRRLPTPLKGQHIVVGDVEGEPHAAVVEDGDIVYSPYGWEVTDVDYWMAMLELAQ